MLLFDGSNLGLIDKKSDSHKNVEIYTEYIESFFGVGDLVRSFFLSRPRYAIRGTGILGRISSFERRLRGAALTPLALPCPLRTST